MERLHRMPFGAQVEDDGSVRFSLWAPAAARVELCLNEPESTLYPMTPGEDGWFHCRTADAGPGSRYLFRIDGDAKIPDPASRYQPEDVHGPSEVVGPASWDWHDGDWSGLPWERTVVYELHVGAFTPEGTFKGVEAQLDYLAELGVTAVELMPVADFPGERNWGYDGVLPYAPDSRYGRPEDLKSLVQAAHRRGMMVFLDVVYNHFGPEGNYLGLYAPQFFTERHHTPWGAALNFDGDDSVWVRQFFIQNALYWLNEYNMDGLRLDAVHAILDDSSPDILQELADTVYQSVPGWRNVHLVLENDGNEAHYLARDTDRQTRWYVAQWNDDIHHALHVIATGETQGYYADYCSDPRAHLARCLSEGFAYQGEPSPYREGRRRGEPSRELPPTAFVSFLQNHDQVGNRAFGERIHTLSADAPVHAATAIVLLSPPPPLLFMGEEWGARQPFPFFCDFEPDLAPAVTEGRRQEFAAFAEFSDPEARHRIPDPGARSTFDSARLNWTEREQSAHSRWLGRCKRLLQIRHGEIVPRLSGIVGVAASASAGAEGELNAEWRLGDGSMLTLLANLSDTDRAAVPAAEGRVVYATHDDVGHEGETLHLPPWAVIFYLNENAAL